MVVSAAVVRRMTSDDIDAVAGLEVASFTDPWPRSALVEELGLSGRTYVVAEEGGSLVGYGGIMLIEDEAHVMTLAIAPNRRRSGVGTRLLLRLIDEALAQGAEHLTLEVRESNTPALALYDKFGFSAVGRRPRYYRDEDAIVMWVVDASADRYRRRLDTIRESA